MTASQHSQLMQSEVDKTTVTFQLEKLYTHAEDTSDQILLDKDGAKWGR